MNGYESAEAPSQARAMANVAPSNLATFVLGQRVAEGRGDAVALRLPQGEVTFNALWQRSCKAAAALLAKGLQRGDRVVLSLPDGLDFVCLLFGTLAAGGVVVMTNPELPAQTTQELARFVGAQTVFGEQGAAAFASLISKTAPLAEAVAITAHAHAFWLLTSGSTGSPKAAMHRHTDFIAHIEAYAEGVLKFNERDRTMAVSKLHFPYATGMNLLFPLSAGGSAILFPQRASASELLRLAAKHKPTIFSTVPTMTARLLAMPRAEQAALGSLRLAVTAAEPLPPALLSAWNQIYKVPLLDGIGSAEMFHVYVTNRPHDVRPGCLGVAVPGYETRVVGQDLREVEPENVGHLWVRGPSAAVGYHESDEMSARVFLREGWVVTGDLFRKTADGYHYYEGRSDDLMKVAGLYVSPLEVEAVVRQHSAVVECAVVGRQDEHGLMKPHAFVVLAAGFVASDALWAEMASFARNHLLGYKVPKWWVALESLPRNDRGKVVRRALRDNLAVTALETHTAGQA